MAPIALTSSVTSPPGLPAKQAYPASLKNAGINLDADGSSTPYSTTSTAVSEYAKSELGSDKASTPSSPHLRPRVLEHLIDDALPATKLSPGDTEYYAQLIASSRPTPATKPGATVYGSAIDVVEAFAAQQSESVWVYDDAAAIGFGIEAKQWGAHTLQTRQCAGLELAGYAARSSGKISVFASTSTLPDLLPNLESVKGDIVIHLATTAPGADLGLTDSLSLPGVLRKLCSIKGWDVIFSSDPVQTVAKIYGTSGRIIHVLETTHSAREVTSYKFPAVQAGLIEDFALTAASDTINLVPASHLATTLDPSNLLTLYTLSPNPDSLFAALTSTTTRKTVNIVGASTADAEALKTIVLSTLFAASGSSKAQLPILKAVTPAEIVPSTPFTPEKTISFYTAPLSPLPELLTQLFLASPSLHARLAQYGSASARGIKSILTLSSAPTSIPPRSDVIWVSDANVLKMTDVLSDVVEGGIVVLELPWTEEEVPVKLTRAEIETIQQKKLRVFLLDLSPGAALPIKEQVAFLLLYTGAAILPRPIRRVLDAYHAGNVEREDIEEAQAGLSELAPESWQLQDEEKPKVKSAWDWDALPSGTGLDMSTDAAPELAPWTLAARHMLFREAYAVESSTSMDIDSPAISALRPSTSDETFLITVSENRRLTPETYDRNVFHMEFDTSGTGLKYEIGEAIGIHGWNDAAEVLDFCSWYGLHPDELVTFQSGDNMETRTVFQLLQQNIDLFGRPGKAFYAELSKFAKAKSDQMTLKFISAPEGAELFKRMAEKDTVTFADVLQKFKTARPGIEVLVALIPEIKPRHYSIASSQKAVGDKVELLVVTVDWMDSKGEW